MSLKELEMCMQSKEGEKQQTSVTPFNEHFHEQKSEVKKIEPAERPSIIQAKKEKEADLIKKIPYTKYKSYALKPGKNCFWNQPQEVPPTKIKIHHSFDPSLHFNHKMNVTIRNINAVIRLIFKNTKDQAAITAVAPGNTIH